MTTDQHTEPLPNVPRTPTAAERMRREVERLRARRHVGLAAIAERAYEAVFGKPMPGAKP